MGNQSVKGGCPQWGLCVDLIWHTAYNPRGPQRVVFLGLDPYSAAWGRTGTVIQSLRGGFLPVSMTQNGLETRLGHLPLW